MVVYDFSHKQPFFYLVKNLKREWTAFVRESHIQTDKLTIKCSHLSVFLLCSKCIA